MDIGLLSSVTSQPINNYAEQNNLIATDDNSFSSVLHSMIDAVDETNQLQNKAEEEEIRFALGYSENTHDLQVAASKAEVALQYTVAVRDKIMESYKEIMQMQM